MSSWLGNAGTVAGIPKVSTNLAAWDVRTTTIASQPSGSGGPYRHPTPLDTSPGELRRSLSPSTTYRLRDQHLTGKLPSTGMLAAAAQSATSESKAVSSRSGAVRSASPLGAKAGIKLEAMATPHDRQSISTDRSNNDGWRCEVESLQAQLRTNTLENEKTREKLEAQAKQTEAALLEVCKSLGMQQQQLEHQEKCTGMIHQLLQEFIPGLPGASADADIDISDKVQASLRAGLSTSIEHLSTKQEQLLTRIDNVEAGLATLQRSFTSLQQRMAGDGVPVLRGELPDSRKETMASLQAANCALGDILAEIAPTQATSAGSSPYSVSNSKNSQSDDVSARALIPLRVELEMHCKDARDGLEQMLREELRVRSEQLLGTLRGEQSDFVSSLQQELEALRLVLRRQQVPGIDQQAGVALGTELEAQIQEVSQSLRQELESMRVEFEKTVQQKLPKSLAALASVQDQQAQEFTRQLEYLRHDVRSSGSSELNIKHKELTYLVQVQQNLLSQHAEELESLRQEQRRGISSITSSVKQELDAVSELSRLLHHKVESVCSEAGDRVEAAQLAQQETDASCKSSTSTSPTSCWPILQRKLNELTEQVNDIDTGTPRLPPVEDAQAAQAQACVQANLLQVNSSSASWKDLRHELHSAAEVLENVCAEPLVLDTPAPKVECGDAPSRGSMSAESSKLQVKLESVLQSLQEADRTFAAEMGTSRTTTPREAIRDADTASSAPEPAVAVEAAPLWGTNEGWWSELQERHPDLAHLVRTQHSELVRIVGSPTHTQ